MNPAAKNESTANTVPARKSLRDDCTDRACLLADLTSHGDMFGSAVSTAQDALSALTELTTAGDGTELLGALLSYHRAVGALDLLHRRMGTALLYLAELEPSAMFHPGERV